MTDVPETPINMPNNDRTDIEAALAAGGWKRLNGGTFMNHIGPLWTTKGEAYWRYGLQADARHLNPAGQVHGGVLQTLIDHVLSLVAWRAVDRRACITLHTDSQFLSGVSSGEFIEAHATETHRTRGMIFMRGSLAVGTRPVLHAQGIFKILSDRNGDNARHITPSA